MSQLQEHWRSAARYSALLQADRRGFAWEWLRRYEPYRQAWSHRTLPPAQFGLLAYEDPDHGLPLARPIWALAVDPAVLASRPSDDHARAAADLLDIRQIANSVSVEIDESDVEHWLITDGRWTVRLDLHDGTLLGGPVLLQHHLEGFSSAEPRIHTLRLLGALATGCDVPAGLLPRESRAPRWILELRTADALASGASHKDMARAFYGSSVVDGRWRIDNASFRVRIQRLVRTAKRYLAAPLDGPWFS